MSRTSSRISQDKQAINSDIASIKKKFFVPLVLLIVLSLLNVTLKSDKSWSFSVEVKVTSVTLFLVFLFLLPTLLPWILSLFPQLQSSLKWLREQGIEEVETSVLKIKLRYGLEEASKKYEDNIWTPGAASSASQVTSEEIELRYREAVALVNNRSAIDHTEALRRIDQLGDYYDQVREERPSGSSRTRLLSEISSLMWTLIPKTIDFPAQARLTSPKGGERLSAYKYIEWQPSTDYINLLLSRAIGVLEVPFGQYSALLSLRRVVMTNEVNPIQAREIKDVLRWSSELDYLGADRRRLMASIIDFLE